MRGGECDAAVVPLQNSTSGVVPATLGELARIGEDLWVDGEVEVRVRLALLGASGASLSGVNRVRSHSHAHSQCARWIRFFVDVEGHMDDLPLADAVAALRKAADVVVLGSYARAPRAVVKEAVR